MISHFFIERPIFASVLSIVITLTGGIALTQLPIAQYPEITPPSIQVAISYPGASAQVVADTVAAPIEQQVNGVEGMLYISSQSGNDGSYTLTVTFELGTDLNTALVMVQNRVALAMPQLPTEVQLQGIMIRKKTPDILNVVNFFSPDGRYDDIYLSNFATIYVRDELLRLDGVSDINVLGQRDYSIRIWLDPQKMAALGLNASDVAAAVRSQSVEAAAGQVGQPPVGAGQIFQVPLDTLGRLSEPEEFAELIVKAAPGGGIPAEAMPAATSSPSQTPADQSTVPVLGNTMANGTIRASLPGAAPAGMMRIGGNAGTTSPTATAPTTTNTTTTTVATITQTAMGAAGLVSSSATGAAGGGNSSASGAPSGTGTSSSATMNMPPAPVTNATGSTTTTGSSATTSSTSSSGSSSSTMSSSAMTSSATGSMAGVGTLSLSGALPESVSGGGGGAAAGATTTGAPTWPSTSIVRLKDVARLERGAQNYNQSCTFDGRPSVGLAIHMLPGTNALDVADRVRNKLEELKIRFPEGVDYDIPYDITPFVSESVLDVARTLLEAIVLVGVVVLLFLQSWRAALIPLIAVPVAIIGTFAVMAAFRFTLNNISLFGLVLAIGIVVDDAIVVVENVERWLAEGLSPREAARHAMDEVTGPVVAIALVLCAVFVPCAFIGGIPGQFFRQFAVTISVSTVFSAFNSLTLSPALAAILLRPHESRRDWMQWLLDALLGWFFRLFNWSFGAGTSLYARLVGILLRISVPALLVYAVLIGLTYFVFVTAPKGFVPDQDQGRLIVSVQLPDSASLERTKETLALVEKIALETEGVAHTVTIAGLSFVYSANSSNFGSMFVVLDPFGKRTTRALHANGIMARMRREYAKRVKDGDVIVFGAPPIPGLSVASGYKLMIEDRGGLGLQMLQQETDAVVDKLRQQPGLIGSSTQFRSNTPQLYMDVDRKKVESLGVSLNDLNQTMQIYMGSLYANSYNEFGRYWQVTLQAEGEFRTRIEDVNLLKVRNNQGQMVPLGTLVNLRPINGPVMVTRYNLYTAAPITGTVRNGVSTGEAIDLIDRVAQETLPRLMGTEWTELMFMQIRAGNTAIYVFFLAVVFVFLALAALYESWSLPLAVILVVPLCLLFSIGGVMFAGMSVDIFVQIGLVVLVGLACKNAILIVEFAQYLHRQGRPRFEATVEASQLRLRPILMTSLAFILGVVPLVLATGAGAEMRRSLGTAVFSGMLGVTLFGIFLTPVFFFVIEWFGEKRLFDSATAQWAGSALLGAGLGAALGYLLAELGITPLLWSVVVGATAGLLTGVLLPVSWRRISGDEGPRRFRRPGPGGSKGGRTP